MKKIFYRGDERSPEIIKRDGFDLWNDAKGEVQRLGGIAGYINQRVIQMFRKALDIERWAVTEKNRSRPTISTSLNEGCGGYDGAYIYQIEYMDLASADIAKSPKGVSWLLSGQTLQASKHIALDLEIATKEVVFFTHIPPAQITHYKGKNDKSFKPMSEIDAAQVAQPKKVKIPAAFGN